MTAASASAPAHVLWPPLLGYAALDWGIVAIFGVAYLGMFLGGLPRLKLDRSGVALLGAIAVLVLTGMTVEQAMRAVDLPTIVLLFVGLLVVNHAFETTGLAAQAVARLGTQGVQVSASGPLLVLGVALSNMMWNVPAVMLVGSIANLIVAALARRSGVTIDWRNHARTGVPVNSATLALLAGWLALRA